MKKVPKNVLKKNFHEHVHKPVGLSEIPPLWFLKLLIVAKHLRRPTSRLSFMSAKNQGKCFQLASRIVHEKRDAQRTPDDRMWCAAMAVDPTPRGVMSGTMSNKQDRKQERHCRWPCWGFLQQCSDWFFESSLPSAPAQRINARAFPDEDHSFWNLNNVSTPEHERDGKTSVNTWFQDIKPKFRQSLDKWNKDAASGSGDVQKFVNSCNHDCWLGWAFALDHGVNFVLAASTCGPMPSHSQMESGHDDLVSELGGPEDDGTSSTLASDTKSSEKSLIDNGQKNLSKPNAR